MTCKVCLDSTILSCVLHIFVRGHIDTITITITFFVPLHVCIYSLCCLNSIWTKKWYQIQPTQFFSCRCLASSCLLVIFLGRSCAYSTQHGTLLSSRRSSFAHLSWVEPSLKCSEFVKLTTHRICKHFLLLHVWSTVPVYCCVSAILVDGDISISCHLLYENYPVVSCHGRCSS